MMEFTQEQKLYAEIVHKAWEDAQFKTELVANPVVAIEKMTGQQLNLPEGKRLVVRDQTDEGTVYINIPAKPNTEDVELNEDQLEAVAGGARLIGSVTDPSTDVWIAPFPICTTSPIDPTTILNYK